jgi:hypothetical protein
MIKFEHDLVEGQIIYVNVNNVGFITAGQKAKTTVISIQGCGEVPVKGTLEEVMTVIKQALGGN